jgi:hypothetical protein
MRLCVERGFARRGKKDGGLLAIDEDGESESVNLGNFKAIVAFRVNSGVTILEEHLRTGANNAMYVSSAAQDDMLEIILNSIHEEIKKEARSQKGKFIYSMSADEDVSTEEQLGVVVSFREWGCTGTTTGVHCCRQYKWPRDQQEYC